MVERVVLVLKMFEYWIFENFNPCDSPPGSLGGTLQLCKFRAHVGGIETYASLSDFFSSEYFKNVKY